MIEIIEGKSINELVFKALKKVITEGYRTPSRNGDINTIYNAFTILKNPKSRHLSLVGRKNNIFASAAETFWVFAGSNNIDPYLSFFLPRAKDFSDDGKTWRGGYPERLINGKQIDDVIEQFRNEGIFTRRATIYIGDPNLDTYENLEEKYGIEKTLDKPCNMAITFFVTPNKKLNMNVLSRSGDIIWGWGSINIFVWTFLQEMILQYIQTEIDSEVTLGEYHHHVVNLHLYDFNGKQGYEAVERELEQSLGLWADDKIEFPDVDDVHSFFKALVRIISETVILADELPSTYIIDNVFLMFDVPKEDNILYDYAKLVYAYACYKKFGALPGNAEQLQVNLSEEAYRAFNQSSFRKFPIENRG